ncbi:hypothetical protein BCI9360_00005 [Bacillus sp. CECT 9360]|nr:hypothetical protein BCI9360_00005 [Bacillus sp. CECT 9360]
MRVVDKMLQLPFPLSEDSSIFTNDLITIA